MNAANGIEVVEIPGDSWDLGQLASFCLSLTRRTGREAWLIGRALNAAKPKVKASGLRWMAWVKEHCPGQDYKTLWRYGRVAKMLLEVPPAEESLSETYVRAGLKEEKKCDKVKTHPSGKAKKAVKKSFSWAVEPVEPVEEESPQTPNATAAITPPSAESEPSAMGEDDEMLEPGEALREEINDHLPLITKRFAEALDWILEFDKAERTACWVAMDGELCQKLILVKHRLGLLIDEIKHSQTTVPPQTNSPAGEMATVEPCQSYPRILNVRD